MVVITLTHQTISLSTQATPTLLMNTNTSMEAHMAALRQRSETRNVGTKWEADDNRKFIAMAKSGASEAEMASTFLRTENGIREHLKLLVRQGALSESTLPLSQPTATPPLSRASSASQLGSQHSLSQPTTPARANKRWGANEERTLKQYLSTST